jgi:LEA14-like dessication related protein
MNWKLISIVIAVIVGGSAIFYFGRGIEKTAVEKVTVNGITDITTDSFTVSGTIYVHNPSQLPVPIDRIEYDIILDKTGQKMSSGTTDSFTLAAQQSTPIPFEHAVRWVPTATTAASLITEEHVYATISGDIYVGVPGAEQYGLPFKTRVDMKEYVAQFAKTGTPVDDQVDTVTDKTGSLPVKEIPSLP